jgi:hypothetical protein
MKKLIQIAALASLLTSSVFAAPIIGQLDFTGNAIFTYDELNGTIVSVDFDTTEIIPGMLSLPFVTQATGDFAPALFQTVTIIDPWLVSAPAPYELWTVAGFSYTLENILTNDGLLASIDGDGFELSTFGTLNHVSYDATPGVFTLTSQPLADPDNEGFTVNVSFSSTAVPVPEPSTYAMFGTAFAILGFVGYRKRKVA